MSEGAAPEPTPRDDRRKGTLRELTEFVVILVVAFVLVFGFIRPFVVMAYRIPSESMVPTLEVGDRVLANKFIYRFTEPERGDIVIFDVPYQPDPLIKRVIGLPGDRISVRDGELFVNGEPRKEPYVVEDPCVPGQPRTCSFGPVTVPEDHYFMMGDNRANSRDSRFIGPVPEDAVRGEAFLRFWPPNRIGLL
jgi:signal peptidase I